nr:DUF945 family protein [Serratia symbiotica]
MATETTTQAARLQGYNAEDARKLAQQQVQGLATMSKMFKLATQKDNVISSNLHYADSQFDLNGSKMSLQEFMSMFGLPVPKDSDPTQGAVPAAQHPRFSSGASTTAPVLSHLLFIHYASRNNHVEDYLFMGAGSFIVQSNAEIISDARRHHWLI